MNIWQILEIEETNDLKKIKQAYAKKIKQSKPETDPEGFQLARKAYELAQQYAAGNIINPEIVDEINSTHLENGKNRNKVNYKNFNPTDLALYLLDVLFKNEKNPVEIFNNIQKEGMLDNLDFSEQFQKILAINLLTATIRHYAFIAYLIEYFKWYEHPELKLNTFFGIALTNLINQTNPYQFVNHLKQLSVIQDKNQAKIKNVDWNECFATKLLFNTAKPIKFFFIRILFPKKRKAIISLIKFIEQNYPQAIVMGLNLSSVAWWEKCKNKNYDLIPSDIYLILFILLLVCSSFFFGTNHSSLANKSTVSITSPIPKSPVSSLGYKILLNKDIKVNYSPINISDALEKNGFSKPVPYEIFVKKEAFTTRELPTQNTIDKFAREHNIFIEKIVRDKFSEQISKINQSKIAKILPGDILVSIEIIDYGLKQNELSNSKTQPELSINITATQNNKTIWDSKNFSYKSPYNFAYTWNYIKAYPQTFNFMLNMAAEDLAKNVLNALTSQ